MHEPVLVNELIRWLEIKPDGTYMDGTVGSGGHSMAILEKLGPTGRLIGVDRDAEALRRAQDRIRVQRGADGEDQRCTWVHSSFAEMGSVAERLGVPSVDGIVLDIGVSSEQLESPERGFSLMHDGPLDMRMNAEAGLTAADLVAQAGEDELVRILDDFGEEPMARRIARAIVTERARAPLTRTTQLADLVSRAAGGRRGRLHPATRTFQALRIAVNGELDQLDRALEAGLKLLAPGGRFAVISFHSLEDRRVKQFFVRHAGRWESLAAGGQAWRGEEPAVTRITRKPLIPGEEEVRRNPRARSAKLRVVEKKTVEVN